MAALSPMALALANCNTAAGGAVRADKLEGQAVQLVQPRAQLRQV